LTRLEKNVKKADLAFCCIRVQNKGKKRRDTRCPGAIIAASRSGGSSSLGFAARSAKSATSGTETMKMDFKDNISFTF
jgi:hypothetical protein